MKSYCMCGVLSISLLVSAQNIEPVPKTVGDIVAQIKKEGRYDRRANFIKTVKVVDLPLQHITSLNGIEDFPGIEHALVLRLPINSIKRVRAGTFKSPKFKKLVVLDLGQNLIEEIEPGALDDLENLKMLLLNDNNLTSLSSGVIPHNVKIISIGNNPRPSYARRVSVAGQEEAYRKKAAADLEAHVKQQAPQALVYAGPITRQFIQRAIIFIGAVAAAAGIIWYAFFKTKPVEGQAGEPAASGAALEPQVPVGAGIGGPVIHRPGVVIGEEIKELQKQRTEIKNTRDLLEKLKQGKGDAVIIKTLEQSLKDRPSLEQIDQRLQALQEELAAAQAAGLEAAEGIKLFPPAEAQEALTAQQRAEAALKEQEKQKRLAAKRKSAEQGALLWYEEKRKRALKRLSGQRTEVTPKSRAALTEELRKRLGSQEVVPAPTAEEVAEAELLREEREGQLKKQEEPVITPEARGEIQKALREGALRRRAALGGDSDGEGSESDEE